MRSTERLRTAAEFRRQSGSRPSLPAAGRIWIYGAGSFGRDVATALERHGADIAGFVEQTPRADTAWGRRLEGLHNAAINIGDDAVAVAVFNRLHPLGEIHTSLQSRGIRHILMPWDYYGTVSESLGWRYWLEDADYIPKHWERLEQALHRLEDPISRECLMSVAAFRSGLGSIEAAPTRATRQYFNELTLPHLPSVVNYLDGGAYDGDTFQVLASEVNIGKAWLFEPDITNFERLRQRLGCVAETRPCLLPLALSNRHERLTFAEGHGEASCVTPHATDPGVVGITAVAVDDVIGSDPIDFIKLDIEGGERSALMGARRTIERQAPVLAISAYHRPEDIWALIEQLDGFECGYRYWLRQHQFNTFELVLYAVRRDTE